MPSLLNRIAAFPRSLSEHLRVFFYRYSFRIARNPYPTLIVTFLLAPLLLIALLRLDASLPTVKVYTPSDAPATRYRSYVRRNFGFPDRRTSLLFQSRHLFKPPTPLDSKRALRDVVEFTRRAFQLDPPARERTPNNLWLDRCVKAFDHDGTPFCFSNSVLDIFYNASMVVRDADNNPLFFETIDKQLAFMTDDDIRQRLQQGVPVSWSGLPFKIDNFLSRDENGRVIALLFHTFFYEEPSEENDQLLYDERIDAFDRSWIDSVHLQNKDDSLSVTALYDCRWSRYQSSETAVYRDLVLFPIGLFLLTAYLSLFLGELHAVYSRVALGLVAILTCALAIAGTFGIAALLKLPFTAIHYVLLLLLIGIGIDDIMVVTRALTHVDRDLNRDGTGDAVPHKIAEAMGSAGVSIVATSATNMVVFLVSASTSLRGFRSFALWAAIGVVLTFTYTSTFFVAALALDQRRIERNKKDIYCCYGTAAKVSDKNFFGVKLQPMSRFFGQILGPFITRPPISVIVILLFAGLGGVGIWGATRLVVEFEPYQLYMRGTPGWKFSKTFIERFKVGQFSHVYIRNVDFSTAQAQEMVLRLCHPQLGSISRNKWVENGSVSCWLHALREANNITDLQEVIPSENLVEDLFDLFGSSKRAIYTNDVVLKRDRTIKASRFTYTRKYVGSAREQVEAMTDIRRVLQKVRSGDEVFSYSSNDLFTEQYAVLREEMAIATGIACGSVFLLCCILSGHPTIALICVTLVGLVVVDIVGFVYLAGFNLNAVTLIIITISVGIGVDFVLHIARSFQDQVGTRRERAISALQELGPAVLHAGVSTLLSILVPGMSRSYVFRTLFWGLFSLLGVAALHGVILGPVLLALVGPKGWYSTVEEQEEASRDVLRRALRQSGQSDLDGDKRSDEIEEGQLGKEGKSGAPEQQHCSLSVDVKGCSPVDASDGTQEFSEQLDTNRSSTEPLSNGSKGECDE